MTALDAVGDFGLPAKAVSGIKTVMSHYPDIHRAIVYGSRAKGNYRPGSDIDLTLDAPTLAFAQFLRIDQELDDLMLPYRIDLSILSHINNPDLTDHITRVGQVLWKNPDHVSQTHHSLP